MYKFFIVNLLLVALHPEGVDRNSELSGIIWDSRVALHSEGVDRNVRMVQQPLHALKSPSTRRAWIEIPIRCWTI